MIYDYVISEYIIQYYKLKIKESDSILAHSDRKCIYINTYISKPSIILLNLQKKGKLVQNLKYNKINHNNLYCISDFKFWRSNNLICILDSIRIKNNYLLCNKKIKSVYLKCS